MPRYLALFGSINVNGKRLVMADLRAAFEAVGSAMSKPWSPAAMCCSIMPSGPIKGSRKSSG